MSAVEVEAFLKHLTVEEHVSADAKPSIIGIAVFVLRGFWL